MPLRVVTQVLQAHRVKDWQGLRELLHPDAQIGVVAAGGKPGDPERAIAAMQAAHEDGIYGPEIKSSRVLDEHAVLLSGHVEYRSEQEGGLKAHRVWLYVIIDNLLYRSQVFESEEEARDAYNRLGVTLGVPKTATSSSGVQAQEEVPPHLDAEIRAAKNEAVLRDLNERLEPHNKWLNERFSEWVCECANVDCAEHVELSVDEYEKVRAEPTWFVLAPGNDHLSPDIERVVQREQRFWVVEKIGVGTEISEELNPRST
jgi:hypothetical protein